MPDGFMVPGGPVTGDAFTARLLYKSDQHGRSGATVNAAKAGCLYLFCAYITDASYTKISFSGGHALWSLDVRAESDFKGAHLEVWAADTDGSVTVLAPTDFCQLIELGPDD